MKLSIIIPTFNEEGNINELYKKITKQCENLKYEIIFINDGSTDSTKDKIDNLYNKDKKHIKIIEFSRNFGKEAAMLAGLKHSCGEYTAIIDSDLQQNPKYLIAMLNHLETHPETDQIAMVMKNRKKENIFARINKKMFYSIINRISNIKLINGASDFRMFRRNVVEAICEINEANRFSKGIFYWIGFNTEYMYYEVEKRYSGKTKFKTNEQIKYAIDGIINYSNNPLKVATILGTCFSLISIIYFSIIIIKTLIIGKEVPGYASILCTILLIGGIQLFILGLIGEYISKTYTETKKRPLYICKNKKGFKDDNLLWSLFYC